MKVRVSYLLTAVALLPTSACSLAGFDFLTGSGIPLTKQFDDEKFSAVEVHNAFAVEIRRADKFDVSVTADDNILEFVTVSRQGDTLNVGIESGKNVRPKAGLKVTITMPDLEGVVLDGACTGTVEGFTDCRSFRVELHGASSLGGEIEADRIDADVAGASTLSLRGAAKSGTLEASGASRLHLRDLALTRVDVHLSGACSGTVLVNGRLDYDVSGASHLDYYGRPTLGKHESSGASSATQK
jgi:hypothetical protein